MVWGRGEHPQLGFKPELGVLTVENKPKNEHICKSNDILVRKFICIRRVLVRYKIFFA